jgi:hypothetical protein
MRGYFYPDFYPDPVLSRSGLPLSGGPLSYQDLGGPDRGAHSSR